MALRITNITVGYDRKRQPAQFESAGSSVHFTLSEDDAPGAGALLFDAKGETDYVSVARMMLGSAKTLVLQELGVVPVGQSASAHERPKTEEGNGNGTGTGTAAPAQTAAEKKKAAAEAKKKADAEAAAKNPPATQSGSDIPGEPGEKTSGKPPVHISTASVNDDIPGEDTTKPQEVAKPTGNALTHAELLAYISGKIAEKKLDSASVKALTATYKAPRIADIPVEKLPEYKTKLDAKIAELNPGDDL